MTLAQIQAIAYDNAKKDSPETNIYQRMFGSYNEEVNKFREQGILGKMRQDPTAHFFKAVTQDENGQEKIMGWTLWFYFTNPKIVEFSKIEDQWPSTANVDCANEFIGDSTLVRAKYMSGKRFGCKIIGIFLDEQYAKSRNTGLQTLCVLPEYVGNGVGSGLLRHGFSAGRGLGLDDFWVEATRDGHDLYEKFGFRDVEATPMNLDKYGGKGTAYIWGMRCTD